MRDQAHFQKAKILAKQGEFDAAQAELKAFSKSKSDGAADELVSRLFALCDPPRYERS